MGKNSTHSWSITKTGPQPLLHRDRTTYEFHERSQQVYSQWMSGIAEEEIASFFRIELADVLRDVQHVQQTLPVRTVISHLHDRNRVLILRAEGQKYQDLLRQSLETPAAEYLRNGVSPTGVLKEFREATGMVEKPGSLISVTRNTAVIGSGTGACGTGIRSYEDLLRSILAADPSLGLTPIDVIAEEDFSNGGSGPTAEGTDQPEKNEASDAANAPNNEKKWHSEGDGQTGNAPYSPDSLKDIQTGE